MKKIGLIVMVCFVILTSSIGQNVDHGVVTDPPPGTVISSWFGNTLPGSNGHWVQDFLGKIQVQADGTVYGYCGWDEAGLTHPKYKNGQQTGTYNANFDVFSVKDKNGNTWTIENIMYAGGSGVVKTGSTVRLPNAGKPISLALTTDGKIMVADNGPDQQIKFYDVSDANNPVLSSTLGNKGGYLATVPVGKLDTLNFAGLRGCGMDAAGNIYVSGLHPGAGSGSWISAHKPDGTVLWRMIGETFLQTAAVDPATDGIDLFSGSLHYKMDYSKPVGKEQGDFPYAVTADFFKNATTDDRLAIYDVNTIHNPETASYDSHYDNRPPGIIRVLNIGGNKYIFGTSQNGGGVTAIKFTDKEQATTFHISPQDDPAIGWGIDIDDDGGVWMSCEWIPNGIRYYKLKQIEANGDLSYEPMQKFDYPSGVNLGLASLGCRIHYDSQNDVLFFSAFTDDNQSLWGWGRAGSKIFRYDGWKKGARSLHSGFPIILPNTSTNGANSNPDNSLDTKGIAWAGKYIFVVYSGLSPKEKSGKASEVSVFDADNGVSVGTLDVTGDLLPNNGSNFGWTDITNPVNAYKRTNGEYLVIMEEDFKNKNLLWRWCPDGNCVEGNSIMITSPVNGKYIKPGESTTITANATFVGGIQKVNFYVNDTLFASDTQAPYAVDLVNVKKGEYKIGAKLISDSGDTLTAYNVKLFAENKKPSVKISFPQKDTVLLDPATATIKINASDIDGSVDSVLVYENNIMKAKLLNAPYEYPVTLSCGEYNYFAVAFDNNGASDTSFVVKINVIPPGNGTKQVLRKLWKNINGDSVLALTANPKFPYDPTTVDTVSNFESPEESLGDNYGQQLTAWLIPPSTGLYNFWIASDDNSRLLLSTDSLPANKKQIAAENGWSYPHAWDNDPSQKSDAIMLEKDKKYYIEALQKQGGGGNNLGVAWSGPCIGRTLITGDYLTLYNDYNKLPSVNIAYPLANTTIYENDTVTITANASDPDGTVDSVYFYIANKLVGVSKFSPFTYTWKKIPVKSYDLKVRAWDNKKAYTYSPVVKVNVIKKPGTSIQTAEMEAMSLYPNPAVDGNVTLANMPNGNKVISIQNTTGQVIALYKTSNSDFVINNLKLIPGIYIVKVSVGNWNSVMKLIVK